VAPPGRAAGDQARRGPGRVRDRIPPLRLGNGPGPIH
jgi:hypothetical protein